MASIRPGSPQFKAWAEATRMTDQGLYGSPEQLALLQSAGLSLDNLRNPEQKAEYFRKRDSGIGGAIRKVGGAVSKVAQVGVPLAVGGGLLGALSGAGAAASGGIAGGLRKIGDTVKGIGGGKLGDLVDKGKALLPEGMGLSDILAGATGAFGLRDQLQGRSMQGDAMRRLDAVKPRDLSNVFQSDNPYARPSQSMKRLGGG